MAIAAAVTSSRSEVLRRDAVAFVAASVLFLILARDDVLGFVDGSVLLAVLVTYLVLVYLSERSLDAQSVELHRAESEQLTVLPGSAAAISLSVIGGLLLLVAGSRVLLTGAVGIAADLGISQAVTGLIFVAIGTSLPELSICVIATLRHHADVAIGNVLGSNIFNLLGILGVSALLQPLSVPERVLHFDQWVMLGMALLLLLFLYTGSRLNRIEGAVLVLGYGAYVFLSFALFNT